MRLWEVHMYRRCLAHFHLRTIFRPSPSYTFNLHVLSCTIAMLYPELMSLSLSPSLKGCGMGCWREGYDCTSSCLWLTVFLRVLSYPSS